MDKVITVRNNLEDDVIQQWVKSHNTFCKDHNLLGLSASVLGNQSIIVGRPKHEPVEVQLCFGEKKKFH